MAERTYGEITGFPPGSTFANRRELAASGVHRPLQGGICGGRDGAESIVVSGGYDDKDYGTELVYTGQGGRDANTGRQVADQALTLGNAGLARSKVEGYLIRVIRGAGGERPHSPTTGLRYDGLFRVADFWHETSDEGFRLWRFRLVAHNGSAIVEDDDEVEDTEAAGPAARTPTTVQRIVRSTGVAKEVKALHEHTCQVCAIQINTPVGPYAEAAHIRALGKPHNGPDVRSNVLCLCPNHHVMFDAGAIYIDDSWTIRDSATHAALGPLRRASTHSIDPKQLAYHRDHHVP
jgi:putative restriction endonuclease